VVSRPLEAHSRLRGVHEQAKKSKLLLTFSVIRKSSGNSSICCLSGNSLRQVVPTHPSVTKQYKLVPVKCIDAI